MRARAAFNIMSGLVWQSLPREPGAPLYEARCVATGKKIYIISDPVHLFKKLRNQLLGSYEPGDNRGKRHMKLNGKYVVWSHIIALFNEERAMSGTELPYKVRAICLLAVVGTHVWTILMCEAAIVCRAGLAFRRRA